MGNTVDKIWELESKIPKTLKRGTDRVIKGAYSWRSKSQKLGKEYVSAQRKRLGV